VKFNESVFVHHLLDDKLRPVMAEHLVALRKNHPRQRRIHRRILPRLASGRKEYADAHFRRRNHHPEPQLRFVIAQPTLARGEEIRRHASPVS
jgi:hypothetical protein